LLAGWRLRFGWRGAGLWVSFINSVEEIARGRRIFCRDVEGEEGYL
jgi:hypothetical protein